MGEDVCAGWLERTGLEQWRVLLDEQDAPRGGLLRIPMGQRFGDRVVSMTGLAGVAVSLAGRGQGLGQTLMRGALSEMRDEGTALSALYGSTTSFYRRCGYQRAGARYMMEVPLRELPGRSGPLQVRELSEADFSQVEALYAQHVTGQGCLQRGPYLWQRVRGPRGMTAKGFGFYRGDRLEGYTYLLTALGQGLEDNVVEASDLCLATSDAVTTFLGLVAGHRAMYKLARWPSAACSPLMFFLEEPWSYQLRLHEHWMLRIVHLEAALTQRGYREDLREELHLRVDDPWFVSNSGDWVLQVEHGQADLRPGGRGELAVGIGALASLYSGFASPQALHCAGLLTAPEEAQRAAWRIFGGQTPELADFF